MSGGFDVFRLIAAFLVVAIHTSPLTELAPGADFFLTRILARVAVPFFFMVTGYFVLGQHWRGKDGQQKIWKSLKKLMFLYLFSMLLYLPLGLYAGHYEDMCVGKALQMLFLDGTFYHLWYFPACIEGILLVWVLRRFLPKKAVWAMAGALYVLGLLGDSYYGLLAFAPGIKAAYDLGFTVFSYTRNGVFFAPVFLALGADLSMRADRKKIPPEKYALGFAVSFALMTAEGFLLRYFELQRHDSMYVFLLPCMYYLFLWVSCWQVRSSKKLRTVSMWIFILHPAMIVLVRGAAKAVHLTNLLVDNSLVHYLAVSVVSFAGALGTVKAGKTARTLIGRALFAGGGRGDGRQKTSAAHPGEMSYDGRAWIELDRKALEDNIRLLRRELPEGCKLMPAVKADAYGHGAALVARECSRLGVEDFCVASVSEGISLRRQGIKGNILILGYTAPRDFPLLTKYDLIQTVVDYDYALLLEQVGMDFRVHLGVDTGMHRLGISDEDFESIKEVFSLPHLRVEGMFTHLCAADSHGEREVQYTRMQTERFYEAVERLCQSGISRPKVHLSSSYGLLNYPELQGDYARVGIALYGVFSTGEDTRGSRIPLRPVLSLKTRVAAVKRLKPEESAGYGLAFTAAEETVIAAIAIGYADGLPRALSDGGGEVLIRGKRAPVIGRVCMDQTLVDVSRIPDAAPGDIAVVIGSSGEETISVCDIAAQAGTITNEVLSRLGKRLERGIV